MDSGASRLVVAKLFLSLHKLKDSIYGNGIAPIVFQLFSLSLYMFDDQNIGKVVERNNLVSFAGTLHHWFCLLKMWNFTWSITRGFTNKPAILEWRALFLKPLMLGTPTNAFYPSRLQRKPTYWQTLHTGRDILTKFTRSENRRQCLRNKKYMRIKSNFRISFSDFPNQSLP